MKKLEKKLSYFTKVLLVFGLLFNSLSSLSVVFAYDGQNTDNFTVSLDENDIVIKYVAEIDNTDVVTAKISEEYTYLDGESETPIVTDVNTVLVETVDTPMTGELLTDEDGLIIASKMLPNVVFDGTYDLSVSLYNVTDDEDLGTVLISDQSIVHDSGLSFKLYNGQNLEKVVNTVDNKYHFTNSDLEVVIKYNVLPGGLNPTDVFTIDGVPYEATELIEKEFEKKFTLSGILYGDYNIPFDVKMVDSNNGDVNLSTSVNVMYESYAANTEYLNQLVSSSANHAGIYKFLGDDANGTLNVLLDSTNTATRTVMDLYNLINPAVSFDDSKISLKISNSEYDDVVLAYEEVKLLDDTLTLDNFMGDIVLDDTTVISLTSEGLTITYSCVLVGDINGDEQITQEDLEELIDQTVNTTVDDESVLDVNLDEEFDIKDIMYLQQVLKNETWDVSLSEVLAELTAELRVADTDIVSGDEFTVDYVVTLKDFAANGISGIIEYDEEILELLDVEAYTEWVGQNYEGKFLYLGDESLTGTEVVAEGQPTTMEEEEYVLLTMTFKAKKAGTSDIEITTPEYFNQDEYYTVEDLEIKTQVLVNASADNTLKSLTVAGQSIELKDDVLDYEITVKNKVTSVDVEALTTNENAVITSIVSPEELVEGENTITIVVTAENGVDQKIYTITVTREKAPVEEKKEEVVTVGNSSNDSTKEDEEPVVKEPVVENEPEEDKEPLEEKESNLSRIIIIILILLVIAGLIYLIFKDDKDDKETKKANKEINKLKKSDDILQDNKVKTSNKSKNKKKKK